jgi:outer membrane murein-binding lipoprotein Lpp
LEAALKALRESSQALVDERDTLQRRLAEADVALTEARGGAGALQAEVNTTIEAFDKLAAGGQLPRPRERTLSGYVQVVAERLVAVSGELKAAGERIAELEEARKELQDQLATGETALRDALAKIADLQAQIDTRAAEREKRILELEAALAEAQKTLLAGGADEQRISQLIEENRRLAAQIDIVTSDLDLMRVAAEEAKAGLDAARVETEARVRAQLTDQIKAIQGQRDSLQTQLNIGRKQLAEQGKTPLLPADKVAEMLNGLVDKMQGGFGGLRIRDGEVKLKVGFGAVGDVGGFVIPTTDSTPELRENLQEVTFRFDRSASEGLK